MLSVDGKHGDNCPLTEQSISVILVSVKDHQDKLNVTDTYVDAKDINFFPDHKTAPNDTQPYIVLSMQLGLKGPEVPITVSKPVHKSHGSPIPDTLDMSSMHMDVGLKSTRRQLIKDSGRHSLPLMIFTLNTIARVPELLM
jgi:hypothetical protein